MAFGFSQKLDYKFNDEELAAFRDILFDIKMLHKVYKEDAEDEYGYKMISTTEGAPTHEIVVMEADFEDAKILLEDFLANRK